MRRREFIALVGGAAAWPLAARAQQPQRPRRIAFLTSQAADDRVSQDYVGAFLQGLQEFGWSVGRNLRIEPRWNASDPERKRRYAAELVALAPDVILATGDSNTGPLLEATRTIPIVFVLVPDPVGAGFVQSLARPGRNATGFTNFEFGMSGKWPELLKQIAPGLARMAVLRDPTVTGAIGQLGAIHAVAPSLRVEASPIDVRNASEIERAIVEFARSPNGALIVLPNGLSYVHRELIIGLAARHRLPAVYPFRFFATDGGLISYGPDDVDQLRRGAGYVDRILKGEKPADLPVQTATKYETVLNLKTAKALGLDVPATVLARADEVIE
jgi:putative ABC transport system substrate-binding protein